jgi:hypothetical protein
MWCREMSFCPAERRRPAWWGLWRGIAVTLAVLAILCKPGTSPRAETETLSIAFLADLSGPGSAYWISAIEGFRKELERRTVPRSVRLLTMDSGGRRESAVASALRSVAIDRARILVLGTGSSATSAVVETLAQEPVVVISLANFDDARLAMLRAVTDGRFFAFGDLPPGHVDIVASLMKTGNYDRMSIGLYGDEDLVRSLRREIGPLKRADLIDRQKGVYQLSEGYWDWEFVIAVGRFGMEFDSILKAAERAGERERMFLALSGPRPAIRGQVAARLLESVVDLIRENPSLLNDRYAIADRLRSSPLIDPRTGQIAVPWDVTTYGLRDAEYLIQEVAWSWEERQGSENPVKLCSERDDGLVVRFTACFERDQQLK